ncbi:hypothetical protein ACFV24_02640 [Nocardia fluminea]|uniref:hypothetical protein n=1 Tax=Nocardia fluminea TaxID=134984 RepID=UPI00366AC4E6
MMYTVARPGPISRGLSVGELERETMPVVTIDQSDNVNINHIPDYVVLNELTGAEQGWMARCRSAVTEGAVAARALFEPRPETAVLARASLARWKHLDSEDDLLTEEAESPDQQDKRITADLSAARALGKLACALTGVSEIGSATTHFLDHAERSSLCSTGTQLLPTSARLTSEPGELASLVLHLLDRGNSPARGFAILTALELAGHRPATLRTAEVNVLLVDAYGVGQVGLLRLAQVQGGPSGLHPDPARMSFLQADAEFHTSLTNAWKISRLSATDACVLWSVTDDRGSPANNINGKSLGAAFAVAIDDLTPDERWFPRFRTRRLDPACAITAGLDGVTLTKVGGYTGKLQAAQRHSLRVVVAGAGFDDATRTAPPHFADSIAVARTVEEAIAHTRTRVSYTLWVSVPAAMVVLALIGTALTGRSNRPRTRRSVRNFVLALVRQASARIR